jgi:hypothetical protein
MTSSRSPRGYLLMEMMLAGAIMAVGLIAAMSHIAAARTSISLSSKRQTAMSLARAKCDEVIAALPTATTNQATLVAVPGTYPGMKWMWSTTTLSSATAGSIAASSTPPITAAGREVTCTVRFPTEKKSIEDMQDCSTCAASGDLSPDDDGYGETVVKQLWFTSPLK